VHFESCRALKVQHVTLWSVGLPTVPVIVAILATSHYLRCLVLEDLRSCASPGEGGCWSQENNQNQNDHTGGTSRWTKQKNWRIIISQEDWWRSGEGWIGNSSSCGRKSKRAERSVTGADQYGENHDLHRRLLHRLLDAAILLWDVHEILGNWTTL